MKSDIQATDMGSLKQRASNVLGAIEALLDSSQTDEGDSSGRGLRLDKHAKKGEITTWDALLEKTESEFIQLKAEIAATKATAAEASGTAHTAVKTAEQAQKAAAQAAAEAKHAQDTANHALDEAKRFGSGISYSGSADSPALNRPPGWQRG